MVYKTISCALLILVVACGLAWRDYQSAFHTPVVAANPVVIEINKGDSFKQITDKLLAQNLDFNPVWFKVMAVSGKTFKKLKTGEYELAPGSTLPDILTLFVQGKTKQYAITFPEGWSFKEVLQEIEKNPNLEHTLNNANLDELMARLGVDIKHPAIAQPLVSIQSPEGVFFPDTYFFEKHTSDIALLKRAYEKMQLVLQQEWLNKAEGLPVKTPYEALILASIVEKETGVVAERPLIAGVFIRRLQTDMLLQTDPTVIYGMGESYQGDIGYADLKAVTPYNTYKNKGLPPTPIAMPGRGSIYAALHPDNSNNLYFVARGDGSHVFSSTLKEHNLAVSSFQKKKKND
ncbi:MAG: endolytic transglycosylase MltG [Methylococcales bacterium]|nr:endolytic transglycosylase MltG [Methylococcales bacterium]